MTITFPNLSRVGRLGNQLWQVASTLGIAAERGEQVSFPAWDYQPFFSLPPGLFYGEAGTDATTYAGHLDERARSYLQDYRLFVNIEQSIRGWFQPSDLALNILADHDWYHQLPRPRTALHVRRGDNVTHPSGYHPLRSVAYYQTAMAELPDTASVVVFSDDIPWCRATLPDALGRELHFFDAGVARPREYVDRELYEGAPVLDWIDLMLMAEAEFHVISNSTYAWWGAFLSADPYPMYPSNWFGWRVSSYTDAALMFPPGWQQIHDSTQGGVV